MKGETLMEPHNVAGLFSSLVNLIDSNDEEKRKKQEEDIMELGGMLSRMKRTEELRQLIEKARPFLESLGKAKAAKLIRDLVDLCLTIDDNNSDIKIDLCKECIQWAEEQNRVFLRQTLQARLVRLLNDIGRYSQSLQHAQPLIRELKKVDDKDLILEVQLEESKAYYHLSNLAKARTSLTSARTTANFIYVPPAVQAALDLQSGILHAADERDFKTAFSYFYEAFEGYDSVGKSKEALRALKYMLLSKVMLDRPEEISSLLSQKLAVKYTGLDIDAIKAIGEAAKKRSLAHFNRAFGSYPSELQCDPVVKKHFNTLSDSMLEKALCRIIEPFSNVQIAHVAASIDLSQDIVERKLAQMILDKKILGTLDQEGGILTVFDADVPDPTFQYAVETIHAMGEVVDALVVRALKIQ